MSSKIVPYPDKLTFFEKVQLYLFDDEEKIPTYHKFTTYELSIKKRYANVFAFWIDKPTLSEKKIINYMIGELGVSRSVAYRDLTKIKVLLGNVRNATKEWQRYKVIAMIDRAYEIAESNLSAKDILLAADKLGKYTQLDKEDMQKLPYDEIVPQNWEITGDVTVMGLEPIPDLEFNQKKMREKYGGALIDDAEIVNEG